MNHQGTKTPRRARNLDDKAAELFAADAETHKLRGEVLQKLGRQEEAPREFAEWRKRTSEEDAEDRGRGNDDEQDRQFHH